MDCLWEDPEGNCAKAEAWIREQEAELVVLPEMFATGFTLSPQYAASATDGYPVQWLMRAARKYRKAIAGSLAVRETVPDGGERYYNRMLLATPEGTLFRYDKRHLFGMGGEQRQYTRGERRTVAHYRGWNMLPLICYDLRFPVWSRNRNDYDLLIYSASWPASRIRAWEILLRARAIENQCYVIGVNRTGNDPHNRYNGHSLILDYTGRPLAETGTEAECGLEAELDRCALYEFRKKFPAYKDADSFTITP